mmetsp:Transcript_12080/g.44907  ORF Transcript_12080/g.44907 Transcript_12080/m.44907 type:complete len:354 (+) Transcript_12080:355-1416(+)
MPPSSTLQMDDPSAVTSSAPSMTSCASIPPRSLGAIGTSIAMSSSASICWSKSPCTAPDTTPHSLTHATSSLVSNPVAFSVDTSTTCATIVAVMAAKHSASFAPATISLTQSTASFKSQTCMYSVIKLLVFSSTFSASNDPDAAAAATIGSSVSVVSALAAGPASDASARSRAVSRSCASRLSFSFSVGMAAVCAAATYGPESEDCFPPPIPVRLFDEPFLPPLLFPPTTSHPSPGPSGNRISSVCAGEMPSAAAASAWISERVIASSFLTRGTHCAFLNSMTSRHKNRTRESTCSLSESAKSRAKYISIICRGSFGDASISLPTVTNRLHSASMFSSGGELDGAPSKSVTHA